MRLVIMSAALLGGMYLVGGMKGTSPAPPERLPSASLVGLASAPPQAHPAVVTLSSTARHLIEERPLGPSRPVVMGEAQPLVQQATLQIPQAGELRRVSARVANVRMGPSTRDLVVGQLGRGEEVLVLNRQGGWLEVAIEGDGVLGWVSESLFAQ